MCIWKTYFRRMLRNSKIEYPKNDIIFQSCHLKSEALLQNLCHQREIHYKSSAAAAAVQVNRPQTTSTVSLRNEQATLYSSSFPEVYPTPLPADLEQFDYSGIFHQGYYDAWIFGVDVKCLKVLKFDKIKFNRSCRWLIWWKVGSTPVGTPS